MHVLAQPGAEVMTPIFHIAERPAWDAALGKGRYLPEAFDGEGFIHCSEPRQVAFIADLLFRGRRDLVILEIDEARLEAEVRRENLEGGDELFPHVYGPIPIEAVSAVHEAPLGGDGHLVLPEGLRSAGTAPAADP